MPHGHNTERIPRPLLYSQTYLNVVYLFVCLFVYLFIYLFTNDGHITVVPSTAVTFSHLSTVAQNRRYRPNTES